MAADDGALDDGSGEASQAPQNDSTDSKSYAGQATTALTAVDIQTLTFPDGSRGTFQTPTPRSVSTPVPSGYASPGYKPSHSGGEGDDGASVTSFAPTMQPAGDIASLFVGDLSKRSIAWNMLRSQAPTVQPFETSRHRQGDILTNFHREFDSVPAEATEEVDDASRVIMWKAKRKHYMILSSAGKPIWSRHGDLMLINSSIGVMQTIISFYEGAKSPLLGFTAGDARFVVLTRGPLYFLAVSKLGESDSQLRAQLDALYMQILSTLTLPTLTKIFVHRPSSDLRKPLQGTESLLSSLADTFTRGSPTTLLGALECLKLRKSQRNSINNTFLKLRSDKLLYGLIIAGGKLVSVIRPRRHSLHPSDLQLIFNMLFESDGIKGGGGENWIPLCLPAFNNEGYLYMYVSFFDDEGQEAQGETKADDEQTTSTSSQIAIVLISTDKESFFGLQKMRHDVAQQLAKSGHLAVIRAAVQAGRPRTSQIVPGNPMSHFLYKSRANVQFCMAALEPPLDAISERRRLMSLYHEMHAAVHAKHAHLKILHNTSEDSTSLAWVTPVFELYCVGGPNVSRATMGQGANKIIQWAKKEEQRLFIIGGGVF